MVVHSNQAQQVSYYSFSFPPTEILHVIPRSVCASACSGKVKGKTGEAHLGRNFIETSALIRAGFWKTIQDESVYIRVCERERIR